MPSRLKGKFGLNSRATSITVFVPAHISRNTCRNVVEHSFGRKCAFDFYDIRFFRVYVIDFNALFRPAG